MIPDMIPDMIPTGWAMLMPAIGIAAGLLLGWLMSGNRRKAAIEAEQHAYEYERTAELWAVAHEPTTELPVLAPLERPKLRVLASGAVQSLRDWAESVRADSADPWPDGVMRTVQRAEAIVARSRFDVTYKRPAWVSRRRLRSEIRRVMQPARFTPAHLACQLARIPHTPDHIARGAKFARWAA